MARGMQVRSLACGLAGCALAERKFNLGQNLVPTVELRGDGMEFACGKTLQD